MVQLAAPPGSTRASTLLAVSAARQPATRLFDSTLLQGITADGWLEGLLLEAADTAAQPQPPVGLPGQQSLSILAIVSFVHLRHAVYF